MLKYNDYIFEINIDTMLSTINESKWVSDNEVIWDKMETRIPLSHKFWKLLETIPLKLKKYLGILFSKSFNFLKNITIKQTNILLNKILNKINQFTNNLNIKDNLISIIIIFMLSYSVISLDDINLLNNNNNLIKNNIENNLTTNIYNIHDIKIPEIKIPEVEITKQLTIKEFLDALSFKESSDNWESIRYVIKKRHNKRIKVPVYVGKYQFGNIAFKDIKSKIRVNDFHKNKQIWTEEQQDKDIIKLLSNNKYYLRKTNKFNGYQHYIGKIINGVKITESGVLASSHLVGNKNVRIFLKTDGKIDYADGNGTKCSDYMSHFSNYDLSSIN